VLLSSAGTFYETTVALVEMIPDITYEDAVIKFKDTEEREKNNIAFNKGREFFRANKTKTIEVQCFKCQGYGHFARECPNKKAAGAKNVTSVDEVENIQMSEHAW
jgi:hypothetical protein